jgi:phage shock protein E
MNKMKSILPLLTGFLLLTACNQHNASSGAPAAADVQATAPQVKSINSQQAKDLLAKQPATVILDVRTDQEFSGGHLENAVNLDYNAPDFQTQLQSLDKNKPYLVYCAVGGRSSKAAQLMQEMGFLQVYNVAGGGFPQLQSAGLPVAR